MFFCAYISIPSQRPLWSRTQVQAPTGIDGTLERIIFRHQHAYQTPSCRLPNSATYWNVSTYVLLPTSGAAAYSSGRAINRKQSRHAQSYPSSPWKPSCSAQSKFLVLFVFDKKQ
jgi:hypothetical protein